MKNIFLKIGYNSAVQSAGKVISVLLSLLTVGLLTRYLGVSGYGNFTLVFAYMSFFGVIADFGLQLTMVRELSKSKVLSNKLYGTYFWLKLSLIVFSTIFAFLILPFFPYSAVLKTAIIVGGIAVAFGNLGGYGVSIFQSNLRLDLVTLVDAVTKIVTVVLISVFIFSKLNLYYIVSTVLIGNVIGLAIIFLILRKMIKLDFSFDKKLARKIMFWAVPIGITSFFSFAYFKVDTIILSVLRSSEEVGIYSLSYKILENILVFWAFYMASVYPLLSKFINQDEKFSKLFKNSIVIATFASFAVIILGLLFAPLVINIFAGGGFSQSITSFRILIFAIPFLLVNNIFYYRFLVRNNLTPVVVFFAVALFINVILNIIFVPTYGYIASSFITVATEIILFILMLTNAKNF